MLPLRPSIHHIYDASRTGVVAGSLSALVCALLFLSYSAQLHVNILKLRITSRPRMLMSTQVECIVITVQALLCLDKAITKDGVTSTSERATGSRVSLALKVCFFFLTVTLFSSQWHPCELFPLGLLQERDRVKSTTSQILAWRYICSFPPIFEGSPQPCFRRIATCDGSFLWQAFFSSVYYPYTIAFSQQFRHALLAAHILNKTNFCGLPRVCRTFGEDVEKKNQLQHSIW